MAIDPAHDMPEVNWVQQGSFVQPVPPPSGAPDAGQLVCIGPFNREYLRYLEGCLDQGRNPSSWLVPDEATLQATLLNWNSFRAILSKPQECSSMLTFRQNGCELQYSFDGVNWNNVTGLDTLLAGCVRAQLTASCGLQTSTDAGATWSDAINWNTYFASCVEGVIIPPVPPLPPGETPDQQACGLAAWLATQIIQAAITQSVNAYNQNLSLLNFLQGIIPIFSFAFPITTFGLEAFVSLYRIITAGNIADFTAASTDGILAHKVQCCIYCSIKNTGYVTSGNYSGVSSCLHNMSYTYPEVRDAIANLWDSVGLEQLQAWQLLGVYNSGADCSSCFCSDCIEWKFYATSANWTEDYGSYTLGQGFSALTAGQPAGNFLQLRGSLIAAVPIIGFDVGVAHSGPWNGSPATVRAIHLTLGGVAVYTAQLPLGAYSSLTKVHVSVPNITADGIMFQWTEDTAGVGAVIRYLEMEFTGANPFSGLQCDD